MKAFVEDAVRCIQWSLLNLVPSATAGLRAYGDETCGLVGRLKAHMPAPGGMQD